MPDQTGTVEYDDERADIVHDRSHDRIQVTERGEREAPDDKKDAEQKVLVDDRSRAA